MSQWVYKDINANDQVCETVAGVWNRKLELDAGDAVCTPEISNLFRNLYGLTNVIKLRDFQYRLMHNKIFCNNILVYWKKVESNKCEFCMEKQDIQHLMFNCGKIHPIWTRLQALFWSTKIECLYNIKNVIFNTVHEDKKHICNKITLIVKQYIYRCKCQNSIPYFKEALEEVHMNYRIELINAPGMFTAYKRVCKQWSPVVDCMKLDG